MLIIVCNKLMIIIRYNGVKRIKTVQMELLYVYVCVLTNTLIRIKCMYTSCWISVCTPNSNDD